MYGFFLRAAEVLYAAPSPAKDAAYLFLFFAPFAAFFAALPPGEAVLRGETTCLRSALLPPLDGLRVLRDGLPLFSCKKGVFRPEHAAGMALTARQALELDAQQANAYLGGAPLALGKDTPQGWALARYQGMPLGWGKGSEDTFKNHLPKGLRQNAPLLP